MAIDSTSFGQLAPSTPRTARRGGLALRTRSGRRRSGPRGPRSGSSCPRSCGRSASEAGRKARGSAVEPGEDLAVERRPLGQAGPEGGQLGVALGDQLLAPGPEEGIAFPRRMSWARMPSHFHSACQSAKAPSDVGQGLRGRGPGRRDRGGCGRRRGRRWLGGGRRRLGVGSQSPIRRWATMAASTPLTLARARVTSCCETPTRKPPLISLFQTNRWVRSIDSPGVDHRPRAGPLVRRVAQRARSRDPRPSGSRGGRSTGRASAGAGRRSRPRRRRRRTTRRTASRARPPPRPPRRGASSRGRPASGLPADQEVDRPGRVGRRGVCEVPRQGLDLLAGPGRLVERGVQFGEIFMPPILESRPTVEPPDPGRRVGGLIPASTAVEAGAPAYGSAFVWIGGRGP